MIGLGEQNAAATSDRTLPTSICDAPENGIDLHHTNLR
jgi:hypothetical protein